MTDYADQVEVGSGTVWKVVSDHPSAPVLRIELDIKGECFELAAWMRTDKRTNEPKLDKNGNKFYGGPVKLIPGKVPWNANKQPAQQPKQNNDDCPF